jgi:hypothetical protein
MTALPLNGTTRPGASADPVFVLCEGRSGSTLLRFLLDAHPDLACPPETNVPALCAQLATVWSLIEGAPLAANRGDEPPVIPEAAIKGIRHTLDLMVGSYLARRGKKRYCDKSLGTARYAELLLRVYPEAKFICLYRHPMDMIASGLEACPWGLSGYGFDPYIASTPGNAVLALARCWADNAAEILAAEEQFPGSCRRVRYEDLVTDPDGTANAVFGFLGVPPVPGISGRCFSDERERFGPADYKIWHTSQITADSVGRGWSIPAGLILPQVLEQVNALADKLGYLRVDEKWGGPRVPADLRVPGAEEAAVAPEPRDGSTGLVLLASGMLGERLKAGVSLTGEVLARRWGQYGTGSFRAIISPPAGTGAEEPWRVDLGAGVAAVVDSGGADDDTAWDVIGSPEAWVKVLLGDTNLSVALRRCELRYCDTGDAGPIAAETRLSMLADLLGLTSWHYAETPVSTSAEPGFAARR